VLQGQQCVASGLPVPGRPPLERDGHPAVVLAMAAWPRPRVDAFLERQTLNKNRDGVLCTGADGPRAGAGRFAAWCEARWCSLRRGGLSAVWGRTVRGLVRG
jgi:hypothetical protein